MTSSRLLSLISGRARLPRRAAFVGVRVAISARRESLIKLKEALLQSELDIQRERTYTVEETVSAMRKAVAEVSGARKE